MAGDREEALINRNGAPPGTDRTRVGGWRDGVAGWRDRLRSHRLLDPVYRIAVAVVGFGVIALGLVLVPFPGPGWLVVFVGLGILATEFAWARRLLLFAKATLRRWTEWLTGAPLLIRVLVAVATLLVVAAVVLGYLAWQGIPDWLPFLN